MERNTLTRLAMTMLLAVILCCACSRGDEPAPDAETGDGLVDLVLKLSVNSGSGQASSGYATRASGAEFESPENATEGVASLRIIIVRSGSNNLVEYNTLINYPASEQLWQSLKEEKFKVAGGEWKRIYLIANEASLPEEISGRLTDIAVDEPLGVNLEGLTLSTPGGTPYIDNTGSSGMRYIPMSEFFDIKVKEAVVSADNSDDVANTQSESLFMTRSTVKFSFTVADADGSHAKGLKVTSLSISGLGDKEWLFPRDAVYFPGKYAESTNTGGGREILSFDLPADAAVADYTFTPANFGLKGTSVDAAIAQSYSPQLYFLESGLSEYYLTVATEVDGLTRVYPQVALPNLPLLPRNTHVRINISFKQENLYVAVDLLLYIGVTLDPIFGSDDVIKPPKPREETS